MKRLFIILTVAVVFGSALFGIGYLSGVGPLTTSQPIKIAATIFPIFDITRNIVGDKIQVIQIVPAGASPHTFEVTPKVVSELQNVSVILKIGTLDDWIDNIAINAAPEAEVVTLSGSVALRNFSDGSIDPHVWLDLNNDKIIARRIAQMASEVDPKDSEFFDSNLKSYSAKLSEADAEIRSYFSEVKSKNIATFHEAWNYFAARYGLNVVATFESFPGKEPTPSYLASFINAIKRYGLKAVFVEPQFSSQSIEQVASDNGVKLVAINPADGGGLPQDDFIEIMKRNAAQINDVLQLQK